MWLRGPDLEKKFWSDSFLEYLLQKGQNRKKNQAYAEAGGDGEITRWGNGTPSPANRNGDTNTYKRTPDLDLVLKSGCTKIQRQQVAICVCCYWFYGV
jgi:hypothetical protein